MIGWEKSQVYNLTDLPSFCMPSIWLQLMICVYTVIAGLVHSPVYMHVEVYLLALVVRSCTCSYMYIKLGECMALWGEPNEPSIQHQVYIFMQCVDS